MLRRPGRRRVGDLGGVIDRLDYLADLGIDAIWLNPWYPSPMADAGYDVADFRGVDPLFGDLDQARTLIERAHELGLRILLDLAPNHTFDAHPWFQQALAAPPGSRERARYHFGFAPEGSHPWLPQRDGWGPLTVEAQLEVPDSTLNLSTDGPFTVDGPDPNWAMG